VRRRKKRVRRRKKRGKNYEGNIHVACREKFRRKKCRNFSLNRGTEAPNRVYTVQVAHHKIPQIGTRINTHLSLSLSTTTSTCKIQTVPVKKIIHVRSLSTTTSVLWLCYGFVVLTLPQVHQHFPLIPLHS
jgi:hypothetical protein